MWRTSKQLFFSATAMSPFTHLPSEFNTYDSVCMVLSLFLHGVCIVVAYLEFHDCWIGGGGGGGGHTAVQSGT